MDVWAKDLIKKDTYIFDGQGYYQGQFMNHYRHGYGRHVDSEGNIFEGWFKTNSKHGQGRLVYTNGDVYEGHFERDMRWGQGKLN